MQENFYPRRAEPPLVSLQRCGENRCYSLRFRYGHGNPWVQVDFTAGCSSQDTENAVETVSKYGVFCVNEIQDTMDVDARNMVHTTADMTEAGPLLYYIMESKYGN